MARGLQWQTVQLSLAGGVETKEDVRAADPHSMDIARDVQFDELRGTQTRKPMAAMGNVIFNGGTLSNCRRLDVVNGELVLFTADTLYSWVAQQSAWVARGTHLAVNVAEVPAISTIGDQIDGDRAELGNAIVYAWTESTDTLYAVLDKATGAVIIGPLSLGLGAFTVIRPRVVALATKILVFVQSQGALTVFSINPASPGLTSGPVTVIANGTFNAYYDVVKVEGQDLAIGVARRATTTSYSVFTVTAALVVTAAVKARTADGPLAIATTPATGLQAQVVRANNTNIQGDLLTTSTLADVFTAQAIGTAAAIPVNQIAACYQSVAVGGNFRCYAFWSAAESATQISWQAKSNFVDNAGSIGTEANFVRHLGVASRACDVAGRVFVWLVFAGSSSFAGSGVPAFPSVALQNTYYLYRDDAFLTAKCVADNGGGFAPSTGRLPGMVGAGSAFAWCASRRRRFTAGGIDHVAFAERTIIDVSVTFDSGEARRAARLGSTLYIAAGEVLQYDGARLVEVGFHEYPWTFLVLDVGGGGSIAAGTYAYKVTFRYDNARGEAERSTTATVATVTMAGSTAAIGAWPPLVTTHKTAVPPSVEVWRTAKDPIADAPFYLVSSPDPSVLTNPNRFTVNNPTLSTLPSFNDGMADATATANETNPENGSVLESIAPPPAAIIIATDTRLLLAGVAGDPDRIWYSRLRGAGEIASFHDSLTIDVPPAGGDITALAYLNETLVVFRETAVYALPGGGFDNLGGGQNFGPANRLSSDVGAVSAESVALTPRGLIFKSRKGWYLLDRSWNALYIGGPVEAFDADTVLAVTVVETQHQVRILTSSRLLMWDYVAASDAVTGWSEWTIADGVHATMWNGSYVYLTATGPKIEQPTYTALTYGLDVESSWIKLNELQGAARVRWLEVLGEYRSPFLMRVRLARDYQYDGAGNVVYYDDKVWPATPAVVGSALQVRHSPSQGQCEAIKVRLTAVAAGARATLATIGGLSANVNTSGTNWNATFNVFDFVAAGKVTSYGEMGNRLTISISFEIGVVVLVDVRDHYAYDIATARWREQVNNIGVRVVTPAATLTVSALEGAIQNGTALAQTQLADPTPSKTINIATMTGTTVTGSFSGGTYIAPTGEACKLTGLGLEVGIKPGLHRRLPAGQKQ